MGIGGVGADRPPSTLDWRRLFRLDCVDVGHTAIQCRGHPAVLGLRQLDGPRHRLLRDVVAAHHELYREGRISLSDLMTRETEHLQLQLRERNLAYEQSLALLRQHAVAGTLTPDNAKGMVWNSL